MKLQKTCSGTVKVVPEGTAYDAAVYREIIDQPTAAPVVELKIEKKKRKAK